MYVKCYELMKVPAFKNIQLIAGGSGLNRLVSWVYVLTTPYLEEWVHGGELLFIVNNENIDKVLKEAVLQQIAGVVILKNKENKSIISENMIDFANEENLPLFEMDYNVRLLDVTREISAYIMQKQEKVDYLDYFFHDILFSEKLEKENLDDFISHYGFHREDIFFITAINSKDSFKLMEIQTTIEGYIEDKDVRFLLINLNSYILILAYTRSNFIEKAKTLLKSSFLMLNEKYPNSLYMGIGNTCDSLEKIRSSYRNAMNSITLSRNENRIVDYDELGFPRLLFNTKEEELEDYTEFILGKIKKHDEENESDYLETIETYILSNGNISEASSKLYIHRNTCVYRISRINELFQIDLDDPYTRGEILNCLYIYRFLGQIK